MHIYVASSWRNPRQPHIVDILRAAGHEVYDFRHPPGGDHLGFNWGEVDPNWRDWTAQDYMLALMHPIAQAGFDSDFGAMQAADACVLVLPCNRSAHLEAGYFVGVGKPLYILIDDDEFPPSILAANPELMYKMATAVTRDIAYIVGALDNA